MQVALTQEDGSAFYLWIYLGCLVAAFGFVVKSTDWAKSQTRYELQRQR